ncbi:MAG: Na+:solute symporter [Proteobacteria bacterium]|nr:Na+:solute symporter [Pseudomonadota bacterium]MCP4920775.1 Na+:solute symporter [Pseudomonadota bacterium]
MTTLDLVIVAAYLLAALGVGIAVSKRASGSTEEYFLAGRSLPWWLAGTSMVATTFAADTPLAVTGLVASGGIAGNWIWWTWGVAHVVAALVFARFWRRLKVVTDAEIMERRYSGPIAVTLRLIKAGYAALFLNCLTMGWVILAMRKVSTHLFPELDPVQLTFGLMALAVLYSMLGGMRSVVITDIAQFGLAMFGAVLLAWFVIDAQGGISGLLAALETTYPEDHGDLLAFFPSGDLPGLPLTLFAVLLTVAWWRQAEGGGYIVQRLGAAKSVQDAERASIWFAVLHNAIRPWPWILVGLAALVVYPLGTLDDREAAYPMLMVEHLPSGLLGLMVASLLAAFMSTIDTHVNWGSSYLVRDVYERFVGGDKGVLVGRVGVVLMGCIAAVASLFMDSITDVWLFVIMLGSGLGSVSIARWLWWRVNATCELVALVVSTLLSIAMVLWVEDQATRIAIVAVGSMVCWIPVAFLTKPSAAVELDAFYVAARPFGLWGPVAARNPTVHTALGGVVVLRVAAGLFAVFGTLFGLGGALLHDPLWGLVALAGLGSLGWLVVASTTED